MFINTDGQALGIDQLVGEDPTPEFLAELNEECQRLLNVLHDKTLRETALWRMQGYTNAEIAKKLNVLERSVERKVQYIRTKWTRELEDGATR